MLARGGCSRNYMALLGHCSSLLLPTTVWCLNLQFLLFVLILPVEVLVKLPGLILNYRQINVTRKCSFLIVQAQYRPHPVWHWCVWMQCMAMGWIALQGCKDLPTTELPGISSPTLPPCCSGCDPRFPITPCNWCLLVIWLCITLGSLHSTSCDVSAQLCGRQAGVLGYPQVIGIW